MFFILTILFWNSSRNNQTTALRYRLQVRQIIFSFTYSTHILTRRMVILHICPCLIVSTQQRQYQMFIQKSFLAFKQSSNNVVITLNLIHRRTSFISQPVVRNLHCVVQLQTHNMNRSNSEYCRNKMIFTHSFHQSFIGYLCQHSFITLIHLFLFYPRLI